MITDEPWNNINRSVGYPDRGIASVSLMGLLLLDHDHWQNDLGLFSLEKRRLWGHLIAAFQYLEGACESWRGTFYKGME